MATTDSRAPTDSVRVFLWSAPRCLSSVFERSIRELKGVKVIFEPHEEAYYHGPESKADDQRRAPSEVNPDATFQAADEVLLQPYPGHQAVFSKNLAYYIEGNYKAYTEGRFSSFRHTFLIRDPRKSILSRHQVYMKCGFTTTPGEHHYKQLHDMLKTVKLVDPNPVVIDADDLLMDPRGMMLQYCSATGLPFDEGMLTWTPGVVADWATSYKYEEWHGTAMMSSGFIKPSEESSNAKTLENLPKEVQDAVEKALPFYEAMYAVRMKLSPQNFCS